MTLDLDDLESKAKAATPGPWNVFVCDDGKQWTGWPLCISATNVLNSNGDERVIVRTGGFYPYEWDNGTSQDEANANAAHIAAASPATTLALIAHIRKLAADKERYRDLAERSAKRAALLANDGHAVTLIRCLVAERAKLVEAARPFAYLVKGELYPTEREVERLRAAIEEVNRE